MEDLHAGMLPFKWKALGKGPSRPAIHTTYKGVFMPSVFLIQQFLLAFPAKGKIRCELKVQVTRGRRRNDPEIIFILERDLIEVMVYDPGYGWRGGGQFVIERLQGFLCPRSVDDHPFLIVGDTAAYSEQFGFPVYKRAETDALYPSLYNDFNACLQRTGFRNAGCDLIGGSYRWPPGWLFPLVLKGLRS